LAGAAALNVCPALTHSIAELEPAAAAPMLGKCLDLSRRQLNVVGIEPTNNCYEAG